MPRKSFFASKTTAAPTSKPLLGDLFTSVDGEDSESEVLEQMTRPALKPVSKSKQNSRAEFPGRSKANNESMEFGHEKAKVKIMYSKRNRKRKREENGKNMRTSRHDARERLKIGVTGKSTCHEAEMPTLSPLQKLMYHRHP